MNLQLLKSNPKGNSNHLFFIENVKEIEGFNLSKDEKKYIKTELKSKSSAFIHYLNKVTGVVFISKLNEKKDNGYPNREKARTEGHNAFEKLKNSITTIAFSGNNIDLMECFLEGFLLSNYHFDKYLSDKKENTLKKVAILNKKVDVSSIENKTDAVHWARYLVDEPVSFLTATELSKQIQLKCKGTGINVEVFEKKKIESLQMGGLLAVNKGSIEPPTFTIMEWKPKNAKNKKPVVLVGKGVVYDTGGLSLKPTANSMDSMKSDMAGAAAMAATVYGVAKLNLPVHVIGLIPATDNRPGLNAYAPGDIITMFNKKTVEVLNTDAEGRMILADALSYSDKFKPELVIDAATLTGAAVRAIGTFASIAMGNAPEKELDNLYRAGLETHDRVVKFPFWAEYGEEMKSKIADLNNLGGPYAGMITAGKFLENFVTAPYIHIDIAGPSFMSKKDSYRGSGGTGAGVRLLIEFLKQKAK